MSTSTTPSGTIPLDGVSLPMAGLQDARPILLRDQNVIWEQTEQRRTRLARMLENACRAQGLEALVLESAPYVHPAWVKFECWRSGADRTITARSSMTVTITAVPYHRFEATYKAEWEKHGRSGSIDRLYRLDEDLVIQAVKLLCGEPTITLRDPVWKLLKSSRLRQQPWQLWRPRNMVVALRPDWVRFGSVGLLIGGFLLLVLGFARREAESRLELIRIGGDSGVMETAMVASVPTVRFTAHQGAGMVSSIAPNRQMSGTLEEGDYRNHAGAFFDEWRYTGRAGDQIVVAMRSSDFDPLVAVGYLQNGTLVDLGSNDDAGGNEGTNAVLSTVLPQDGDYVIVATTYEPSGTGAYTLQIDGPAAPVEEPFTRSGDGPDLLDEPATPTEEPFAGTGDDPDPFSEADFGEGGGWPGTSLFGLGMMMLGVVGIGASVRAPKLVRSPGKPLAEPRTLHYLDSWQTVVFGAGTDADEIRGRLTSLFVGAHQQRFACSTERIWHWGLDGKTEREQMVLRYGRGLIFCKVYSYGSDLYVGWDAHLNSGTWLEKPVATGIDRQTGKRVQIMTVQHAWQAPGEYDLVDLNCLLEWTHAQVTQVLKHYLKERAIDQEIDFTILRGDRQRATEVSENEQKKKSQLTSRFRRKA